MNDGVRLGNVPLKGHGFFWGGGGCKGCQNLWRKETNVLYVGLSFAENLHNFGTEIFFLVKLICHSFA